MSEKGRMKNVIEYHAREAEGEFHRRIGDDLVYDEITWNNIEPFLPKRGRILDAGGGAGAWSIKMAEKNDCIVVLFDVTRDLLKTAKRRIKNEMINERIETLYADIRRVPHPDKSFDFVLCEADPLCICGDAEKAVSELSRVLKPNRYFVAGVDSTLYRVYRAFSQGKSLDAVLDFLKEEMSPAEEEAPFESKSFTPNELIALLRKNGLETVRIVGKPIGFGPHVLDVFVEAIPTEKRQEIFKSTSAMEKLAKILYTIYDDPHVAGIGSHLHVVAKKTGKHVA